MGSMIDIRRLSFAYPDTETPVLDNIDMRVQGGSVTTILGPNGSGKTTLLKCIAGFYKTLSGEIVINGQNLLKLPVFERARLVSYMPQNHTTIFPYRVLDIVLMGRSCHLPLFSSPQRRDHEIAIAALETVGIKDLAQRKYSRLSGGEKQLALIARSLAQQAPVMLMDEPISHLDYRNQITVLRMIRTLLSEHHLTMLIALHDPNMAAAFSDEIILFKNGSILRKGKTEDTITSDSLTALYDIKITVSGEGNKIIQPPNA